MSNLESDMLKELKDMLPKPPPPHSKTVKQLLEELQSDGSVDVNETMLRKRLSKLVDEGKWEVVHAGKHYVAHYWPKR